MKARRRNCLHISMIFFLIVEHPQGALVHLLYLCTCRLIHALQLVMAQKKTYHSSNVFDDINQGTEPRLHFCVFSVIVFFKLAREKPELLRKKVIFLSCNYYFIKLERD